MLVIGLQDSSGPMVYTYPGWNMITSNNQVFLWDSFYLLSNWIKPKKIRYCLCTYLSATKFEQTWVNI